VSFWGELRRRNVFKVGAAYLIVAWLIAQITNVVDRPLGLPEWFDTAVIVLLAIGFPVALIFAWAYELTPAGIKRTDDVPADESITRVTARKLNLVVLGLLVGAALGSSTLWFLTRDSDGAWLTTQALPSIERALEDGDWERAYAVAKEIKARLPNDPGLAELWPRFSWQVTIPSDPPGATVFRRPFSGNDDQWETLGTTPLTDIQIPFGLSLLRFEHEGFPPMTRLLGGGGINSARLQGSDSVIAANVGPDAYKLDAAASLPEGKVRVPGGSQEIDGEPIELGDFFLDKYEVTNRKYKNFVDAGGYARREFWIHAFHVDGRELPFEEAMSRFVDKTGRPGPSTWEAGDYPDGQDEYPVAGVSWYEAAAYARFVNEELPTVYHWRRAFSPGALAWIVPASNVEREGMAAIGEFRGMSWPGTFDMVGNAREWVFNATGEQRFILGGGWNDPLFLPQNVSYAQSPMDRGAMNGFRLMKSQDTAMVVARSREALPEIAVRDVYAEPPVADEVIAAYQRIFTYDPGPLNAQVEATVSARNWTRERISFDAAYGNERMVLYLYVPTTGSAPYKTTVYWPGSNALGHSSIDGYPELHIDFIIKSGRAVAFPVIDGTFERGDRGPRPDITTTANRDLTIRRINDVRRTIDYLETRADIDSGSLSYFGWSWGGWNAPTLLTVEPRLHTAVLYVAYIVPLTGSVWSSSEPGGRMLPEVDPVTYLRKVDVPVLMLNGQLDNLGPLETSVRPFFALLGTAEPDKRHVVAEGGHFVPRALLIRETLDWLDRYQGRPGS
jgi:uncharacterized membrane protein YhdT